MVEKRCHLLDIENAHHQSDSENLCESGNDECPVCLLTSEVLGIDESWNADEKLD